MVVKFSKNEWSKNAKKEATAPLWPSLRSHALSFLQNAMNSTHQLHSVCGTAKSTNITRWPILEDGATPGKVTVYIREWPSL